MTAEKGEEEITRFGVAIIESLRENEYLTGTKIYYDVIKTQCAADETFFSDFYKVATTIDYIDTIHNIVSSLKPYEMLALHVEAHGSEEGIILSSGEILDWRLFLSLCREINIKEEGLLIVTTAMCVSTSFLAVVDPFERSPFLAIVATKRDVSPDELWRGYTEFYLRYKNIKDLESAKELMCKEVSDGTEGSCPFVLITQYWLFDKISKPDEDSEYFEYLVNLQYCKRKAQDPSYSRERTEQEILRFFRAIDKTQREHFLFADYWGR